MSMLKYISTQYLNVSERNTSWIVIYSLRNYSKLHCPLPKWAPTKNSWLKDHKVPLYRFSADQWPQGVCETWSGCIMTHKSDIEVISRFWLRLRFVCVIMHPFHVSPISWGHQLQVIAEIYLYTDNECMLDYMLFEFRFWLFSGGTSTISKLYFRLEYHAPNERILTHPIGIQWLHTQ